MPPNARYCTVSSCKEQTNLRKTGNEYLIFHKFPLARDFVSSAIQKEWIQRCKIKSNKFNPKNGLVCSNHFTENDYERDLQNELLGLPLRRKLKKTAVPTLNLDTINQEIEFRPQHKLDENTNFEDFNKPSTSSVKCDFEDFNKPSTSWVKCESVDVSDEQPVQADYPSLLDKDYGVSQTLDDKNYKQKYENLLKKYNILQLRSRNKIKNLNNLMNYYKNKYYNNPITKIHTVLTNNQIDLISKKKKKVIWTQEEISVAFTIRCYSKKCYLYLREKLKYPLPALSSLRRWASQLDVSQGVCLDIRSVKSPLAWAD